MPSKKQKTGCVKQTSKKYTSRPSPPFPANECAGTEKPGNDERMYKSVPNKNGVHSWKLITASKNSKKTSKKATSKKPKPASKKKSTSKKPKPASKKKSNNGFGLITKNITGESRVIPVSDITTVGQFRKLAQKAFHLKTIRVVLKGKPLEDDTKTLIEVGVDENSLMHVMLYKKTKFVTLDQQEVLNRKNIEKATKMVAAAKENLKRLKEMKNIEKKQVVAAEKKLDKWKEILSVVKEDLQRTLQDKINVKKPIPGYDGVPFDD